MKAPDKHGRRILGTGNDSIEEADAVFAEHKSRQFTSATQLKDWIKNKSKQTGAPANVLLQCYMMERLLERISISSYRENMILKGGFLIAAMVGIDRRSTMDMDATVKGLTINSETIKSIFDEIISLNANDGVTFEIQGIKNNTPLSTNSEMNSFTSATVYRYI